MWALMTYQFVKPEQRALRRACCPTLAAITIILLGFTHAPPATILWVIVGCIVGAYLTCAIRPSSNALENESSSSDLINWAIMNSDRVPVLILDENGKILRANCASVSVCGFSHEQLIRLNFWQHLGQLEEAKFALEEFRAAIAAGSTATVECAWNTDEGKIRRISWSIQVEPEPSRGLPRVVLLGQDVTCQREIEAQVHLQMLNQNEYSLELELQKEELSAANCKLAAIARIDGLTGLINHRTFQEILEVEFSKSRACRSSLSALLLDVDFFKDYNDTFGHPAGDEALRTVAKLVQSSIRDTDAGARYGGEEFAVILPGADCGVASIVAERIRELIEVEPCTLRPITVSIGVAVLETEIKTPAELIERADQALYGAKDSGRNKITLFESIHLPDLKTSVNLDA